MDIGDTKISENAVWYTKSSLSSKVRLCTNISSEKLPQIFMEYCLPFIWRKVLCIEASVVTNTPIGAAYFLANLDKLMVIPGQDY